MLQVITNNSPLWLVQIQNVLHLLWAHEIVELTTLPSFFAKVCGLSLHVHESYSSAKTQADPYIDLCCQALFGLYLFFALLGNCLQAEFQDDQRPHLICFPSLRNQSSVLLFVQYLKTVSYSLFNFLRCKRLSLVFISLSWLEAESSPLWVFLRTWHSQFFFFYQ